MLTIRRLYLYGVSAVSLAMLAVGALNLLQLLLERAARAAFGYGVAGLDVDRELLALSVALLVVGLPLWLFHWWVTERLVRPDTPEADAERQAVVRASYLFGVSAVAVGFLATRATSFVETVIAQPPAWEIAAAGTLAAVLVLVTVLAFHLRVRHVDGQRGPLAHAAAWLGRLYLYGTIVGGAFIGLWGVSRAIEIVGNAVLGTGVAWTSPGFRVDIASAVALFAVGGLIWLAHWAYARRLPGLDDWRGASEQTSMVRAAHGVVATGIATVLVSFAVASTLAWLFAQALGVGGSAETARAIQQTVGPLVAMLPFLAGGWLFGRVTIREAAAFRGRDDATAAVRSLRLTVAAIGLAIGSVGLARALGLALEGIMGPPAIGETARLDEIAGSLPYAIVGLTSWLVAWALVLRDGVHDRLIEARSMVRRLYLFLVVGSSVTAAGLALAFVIYQGLRLALDIGSVQVWELAQPLVIAVVGGIGLVYHLWVLRADLAIRAEAEPGSMPAPVPTATVARVTEELELEGPPGSDVEAVNRVLREHLPSGWTLRVVHHGAGAGH